MVSTRSGRKENGPPTELQKQASDVTSSKSVDLPNSGRSSPASSQGVTSIVKRSARIAQKSKKQRSPVSQEHCRGATQKGTRRHYTSMPQRIAIMQSDKYIQPGSITPRWVVCICGLEVRFSPIGKFYLRSWESHRRTCETIRLIELEKGGYTDGQIDCTQKIPTDQGTPIILTEQPTKSATGTSCEQTSLGEPLSSSQRTFETPEAHSPICSALRAIPQERAEGIEGGSYSLGESISTAPEPQSSTRGRKQFHLNEEEEDPSLTVHVWNSWLARHNLDGIQAIRDTGATFLPPGHPEERIDGGYLQLPLYPRTHVNRPIDLNPASYPQHHPRPNDQFIAPHWVRPCGNIGMFRPESMLNSFMPWAPRPRGLLLERLSVLRRQS